ncbi:MAG TPA: MATE family efflux transporter, partial [Opitutales bacterium]|nr:MATE family efflux transporter [Opitutales bacterium]
MIEVAAWAVIARIVATTSYEHMTVFSVCNTCFIIFACVVEGVQGGVIAVSSNFIGAKRPDLVRPAIRSAIRLLAILFALVSLSLAVVPQIFLEGFFHGDIEPALASMVELALFMTVISMLFDGLGWACAGVLIAAGDTRALLYINATNAWVFALIPTYIWLRYWNGG